MAILRRSTTPSFRVPMAAMLLVGLTGLAATELARSGRPVTGLVAAGVLVLLAGAAAYGLVRRLAAARSLALRDPLTGLPNRALLDDRINQAVARAHRVGESFSLFVIDLDGFKDVNDIRGHDAGDHVLVSTARRLESVLRASDTVARVGGDEFVVLSLGSGNEQEAAALVERIKAELRTPLEIDGSVVEIDASIGWAIFPSDGATSVELMGRADGQMFATKRGGERTGLDRRGSLDAGIVREFEGVLERQELLVYYQPVLDIRSGAVIGAEALVRRVHPARGIVTPGEFLPHVARTPLIRALTAYVVADGLKQLAGWRHLGYDLRLYVNIPHRTLADATLTESLAQLGSAFPIPAGALTFEVVPFAADAASELNAQVMATLRSMGIRLALDDFGRAETLTALQTIPVDEVKISASFVQGLGARETDGAIVRSLVSLAQELGMEVAAKGVETRSCWDALHRLRCDHAQGYYVKEPMPADRFALWLADAWPQVGLAS